MQKGMIQSSFSDHKKRDSLSVVALFSIPDKKDQYSRVEVPRTNNSNTGPLSEAIFWYPDVREEQRQDAEGADSLPAVL